MKRIEDVIICQLMENLTCAHILFSECMTFDENGEPVILGEHLKISEEWAIKTLNQILTSLSEEFGVTTNDIEIIKTNKIDPERFNNFLSKY